MSDFRAALDRTVGPSLIEAGFAATAAGWVRDGERGFNAFSVFEDSGRRVAVFGWRFPALGDPPPEPADARGCPRRFGLDVIAPTSDLRSLLAYPAQGSADQARWRQRLTVAWNRAVVPWLHPWRRPDGFRDYLAERGLHLGAAWVSACLGQRERAERELELAHRCVAQSLADGFDRAGAERDAALAAPFAARHGLAAYLQQAEEMADRLTLDAFSSLRGATAQAKITNPDDEHRRLQHRRVVFAELCRRFLSAE